MGIPFVDELNWDAQDFLDAKGLPVFLMTMLGFLVGGLLGSKFGSRRRSPWPSPLER